jgi:hypothetical protein
VSSSSPNELLNFALVALDHAAESVVASGGPLTPFSLIEADRHIEAGSKGEMTKFSAELLEEGLAQARAKVRSQTGVRFAAVAWDGYFTMDGQRTDAVFVEASQAGEKASVILAQRYVESDDGIVVRLGNPVRAGEGDPLF